MADIFISYAREDVDRVRGLVAALESEGYSVWWDPNIGGGDEWADLLEEEITNAKAVLAIWSKAARKSRWVREEANLGHTLQKLIPISFQDGQIPFGFNTIHAEDFTEWKEGDKDAECWQRLMLKARALAGTPKTNVARAQEGKAPEIQPQAHGGSAVTFALIMLFAGAFLGAVTSGNAVMGGAFAVAGSFFLLFRTADTQLPNHLKALAGRWLLPGDAGARVNVAEAFNTLFEAVFGIRHLSFKCLWRSAFASTFFLAAIFAFALLFVPTVRTAFENEWGPFLQALVLTFIVANIVGDYISLFQTRLFLRWSVKAPGLILPLVILDAILTLIIYLLVLYASAVGLQSLGLSAGDIRQATVDAEPVDIADSVSALPSFIGFYEGLIPQLDFRGLIPYFEPGRELWARTWLLLFSIMTTFITSVWLWLVLIAGPFAKTLVTSKGNVTLIGRLAQVQRVPFTVLGLMVATLLVLIAVPISYFWPQISSNLFPEVADEQVVVFDREDDVAWQAAEETDTIAGYETYLDGYEDGQYAALARQRIETQKEEAEAAKVAERQARIDELMAEMDQRRWDRAKSAGTIEAYRDYLEGQQNGSYVKAAQEAILALRLEAEEEARRLEQQTAQTQAGTVFKDCEMCPEMVVVPAGSFMMGSATSSSDNERPVHEVIIAKPFAVGKFEVTFAEWGQCVAEGGCNGYQPADEGWGKANRPVINVSWEDAKLYTEWLSQKTGFSYRLLTEAEWEFAARAGTTTKYAFGDTISSRQANFRGDNSLSQTVPVGSYSPNAFGLYDMNGNVWEWTEDCWNESYSGAPKNGDAWRTGDCSLRVLRGGSYHNKAGFLRSAFRYTLHAKLRTTNFGFRITRSLEEVPDENKTTSLPVSSSGVQVNAAEDWQSAGVSLTQGKTYDITATGEWNMGPLCGWQEADGEGYDNPFCKRSEPSLVPDAPYPTLIAKIGPSGKPFQVGRQLRFSADGEGELYLRSNDLPGELQNNEGAVEVTVRIIEEIPNVPDSVPVDLASTILSLNASDDWKSSNYSVQGGKRYQITATGEWNMGPLCGRQKADGEGYNNPFCERSESGPVSGASYPTLIGRIGSSGTPFRVGSELRFTAESDGEIYFRSNDMPGELQNNNGVLEIKIEALGTN